MEPVSAKQVIETLKLTPHPEGGHYREIYRDPEDVDGRSFSTSIYFLLEKNQKSHWHRIDSPEIWHWYAGDPLELSIHTEGKREVKTLSNQIFQNHRPQIIVPRYAWQSAQTLGEWTLVGCTVAPGFLFEKFELAKKGWEPDDD